MDEWNESTICVCGVCLEPIKTLFDGLIIKDSEKDFNPLFMEKKDYEQLKEFAIVLKKTPNTEKIISNTKHMNTLSAAIHIFMRYPEFCKTTNNLEEQIQTWKQRGETP